MAARNRKEKGVFWLFDDGCSQFANIECDDDGEESVESFDSIDDAVTWLKENRRTGPVVVYQEVAELKQELTVTVLKR